MIPVIALVGRPNVGKSTLFNRLTGTRDALVANYAGLTRDRQYGEARFDDRAFVVIDTGGLSGVDEGVDVAMAQQAILAIEEADIVLFLVDAREGMTAADHTIAQKLRIRSKPFYVVANKVDGINADVALTDFYQFGVEHVYPITATHGRGVRQMLEAVFEQLPVPVEDVDANAEKASGIKIAAIGRPNVGKSTLVNRMLGEERVVVFDMPGTTRDSIYINYTRNDKPYTIIDTAGVRRRKSVSETIEKFSIVKTIKAIDDANVVILLMDAHEGIVEQDLHLLGMVIDAGRAVVVALNKWDGLEQEKKQYIRTEIERRLQFVDYAEIHFISALHGTGVGNLYKAVEKAYAASTKKLQTHNLTEILQKAVFQHAPPMIQGRRIKLRYAHAGGQNPPIIVIHGNQTDSVPEHYRRYLENAFRRELKITGTPIRLEFKSSENPFAGKKNPLSERQINKRKRLMSHTKRKR
jgi:GTP-binding protein